MPHIWTMQLYVPAAVITLRKLNSLISPQLGCIPTESALHREGCIFTKTDPLKFPSRSLYLSFKAGASDTSHFVKQYAKVFLPILYLLNVFFLLAYNKQLLNFACLKPIYIYINKIYKYIYAVYSKNCASVHTCIVFSLLVLSHTYSIGTKEQLCILLICCFSEHVTILSHILLM